MPVVTMTSVRRWNVGKTTSVSTSRSFIPLIRDPGQRLEADFGHIYVDFPDGRKQVPSGSCWFGRTRIVRSPWHCQASVLKRFWKVTWCKGSSSSWACIPREVWWDNPKTVAAAIFSGRQRQLHARYQALASHYVFEPLFCMPAHGNEKPYVENRVKTLQRRWATPVPRQKDLAELNAYLRACCLKDREHRTFSRGGAELLFQVFADRYERRSLLLKPRCRNLAFSDLGPGLSW